VADHSRDQRNRGRVSHSALPKAALDNTPAAIRSPKDRIATGDHTPRGVPRSCAAKRHTELRAAAAEAPRERTAGWSKSIAPIDGAARPNTINRITFKVAPR
jgi:hypothetical protein